MGSFTAKYLADYDEKCSLQDIHIFEPQPVREPTKVADPSNIDQQGSHVNSLELKDGSIIELGISIALTRNQLVVDMIEGDLMLQMTRPFHTGKEDKEPPQRGFGIFDGICDLAHSTPLGTKMDLQL